jgi:hypothetical protein
MRRSMLGLAVMALAGTVSVPALAGNPFAFEPPNPNITRAYQYAAISEEFCLAELSERGVPFERVAPTRGVETPIRFAGPVRGITFVQTFRPELDPRAPATVLDCRLGLAIDDLAVILARHQVIEVEYLSMWRPGFRRPGVRHGAGRAIDVATVKLSDGASYSVQRDFQGRIGAQTCGYGAEEPRRPTDASAFWRTTVCELADLRSFNIVISPNYDRGHRDHLHLEVRSGIRWFLTQ